MQLGYVGLGKMGKNMVARLLKKNYEVVAWNRSLEPREEVKKLGAKTVETIADLVRTLPAPRTLWLMLPAGDVTHEAIIELADLLTPGDTLIDGSNNWYKNSIAHGELLKTKQIQFFDAGISGGPSGALNGACVMAGGSEPPAKDIEQLFSDVAAPNAYRFFAGTGAGHFVKMVHNGIEYGMMQAIGEGFAVMNAAPFHLDLQAVAELYNKGSVIESRLVDWLSKAYAQHGSELTGISGSVKHSGEGQWTVETAKAEQVPVPIIEGALQFRIDSTQHPSYTGKVVSALRNQFGGHDVKEK